ncbi:hypothetical protein F5146DRAFT_1169035 [Armillaria mellea]|nr:hypothetical protein F5146DRAFT_1169035 [Armillaria mellea]
MPNSNWTPIADTSNLPLDLLSLSPLLDPKIPLELVNGTCILTSPKSSELLEEIATRSKGSPGFLSDVHGDSLVLSMLDLILSTVAALRAISDVSMNDIPRPITPFWSLLLRPLVITCYEKSYILHVYITVKTIHTFNNNLQGKCVVCFTKPLDSNCALLDGHASLLVSHLADQLQSPRTVAVDDTSSITERHAVESNPDESSSCLSDGDEALFERSNDGPSYGGMETSTQPTSTPSSNIPVEARVLSHWRQPDSVALPFLCVADEKHNLSTVHMENIQARCEDNLVRNRVHYTRGHRLDWRAK